MKKENKTVGYKLYRHESNPKEEEIYDEFLASQSERDMDFIVFGHSNDPTGSMPNDYLSDREKRIVVSTIQWLGSPVGQHFLNTVGFFDEEHYSKREHLFSEKIACLEKQLKRIPNWIRTIFK